ncbi:chaperone modulator CbpM [Maritimibacter fusiformis]|uniref:MerR family transcriptional regulator n=1 Tax=Maritimibacter fusiformis TaxID=2603819 RepID=A0A5D0RJ55_9RHOB|nr:chaperone modulator CbpM [Maritimibacter fusiformis]TYB81139.1 MerR family transcriptional regulator [Maritimibacter fusiformis]
MLDEHDVVATVRRVELRELRLWVRQGWIKPAVSEKGPVFDDLDVARIRLVCDLRKEMSLPTDAVPVVLSLVDQIHSLRRELRGLTEVIEAQPDETRQAIVDAYRTRRNANG